MGEMTGCKRFQYRRPSALVSLFLLIAFTAIGCGGEGVRLSSLDVRRVGWDTLRIAPAFERGTLFGGAIVPDSLTVLVSDGGGRTLYTGYAARPRRPLVVPIPDPLLGNEAPFMIDLCGHFTGAGTVCEQHMLTASPKRLHADFEVDYPLGRDADRLRYTVRWSQERERPDGTWHAVPVPERLPARLVLYVRGHPTDALKLDFKQRHGTFDLSKMPGYDDFWMRFNDPLLRGDSVEVIVQLEGRTGPRADSVTAVSRWVGPVSRAQRQEEVYAYADESLGRLLDRLETARDGRAEMRVESWRFDALQRRYRIDITINWSGGFLRMNRFDLEGTLSIEEDTRRATLDVRRLSPDLQQTWYDRIGSNRVFLGALSDPCPLGCTD